MTYQRKKARQGLYLSTDKVLSRQPYNYGKNEAYLAFKDAFNNTTLNFLKANNNGMRILAWFTKEQLKLYSHGQIRRCGTQLSTSSAAF